MTGDTVFCHLCRREVLSAGTFCDRDGDPWCETDTERCKRIAALALTDPDRLLAERLARRHADLLEKDEEA